MLFCNPDLSLPIACFTGKKDKQIKGSFTKQGQTFLFRTPVTRELLENCRQALTGVLQSLFGVRKKILVEEGECSSS